MPTRRQRAATGAALTVLVLVLAGCDKIKSKQEIKKGNEFFKAANYEAALASYQEALKLDPGEKKIYKNIGLAYMGLYQPGSKHPKDLEYAQKAIDALKKYMDAYPDDPKAPERVRTEYITSLIKAITAGRES